MIKILIAGLKFKRINDTCNSAVNLEE